MTKIMGTLHEGLCAFILTFRWILHRMRNVADESCRENQNTPLKYNHFFFRKSCLLRDNVEKYCTAGKS